MLTYLENIGEYFAANYFDNDFATDRRPAGGLR